MSEDGGFDDVEEFFCRLATSRSSFSSLALSSAFSASSCRILSACLAAFRRLLSAALLFILRVSGR
jgi:hypothetical protein